MRRYETHVRLDTRQRPSLGTLVWVSDGCDFVTGVRNWEPAVYMGVGYNRNYSSLLMSKGELESKHNAQIHTGEYPPETDAHETW